MKKNLTLWILSGVIVVLAALLAGILIFLKNQPVQQRATTQIVEVAPMEPDSSIWGKNYPNQYDTFKMTRDNKTDTEFGGSSAFSWLERDPRQKILFGGYGFSKEYNDDRGHEWSLDDVRGTARVNETTTGACYACKSSNNPKLWDEMGLEAYSAMPFAELGKMIDQPIGCANCHEAGSMRLILTNPSVIQGFKDQGINWEDFTRQQMRTVVCANCHVEYYMAGEKKVLTNPWDKGTEIHKIVEYYQEEGFKDWEYPEAGTPMLKAQHPEYEFFTAQSTHFEAGVSCADCHMPYVRDGAAKFSDHNIRSPMYNPELACGTCHTDVKYVSNRLHVIQNQVSVAKIAAEDSIIDAMTAIKAANTSGAADMTVLAKAQDLHRQAQFLWDFVSAENSYGFHNPEYALATLQESVNLSRQSLILAAQAAGDTNLLVTGVYQDGK